MLVSVCTAVLQVLLGNIVSGTSEVRSMSTSSPSAPRSSLPSEVSDVIETTKPHNHDKVEKETIE